MTRAAHPLKSVLAETWLGLGLGVAAALLTLAVALSGEPLLAPFVPIGLMVGFVALAQPVWGAFLLVFFAYPDALLQKLLFMVPGAPYKLMAMMAILGLVLRARDYRKRIDSVFRTPVLVAFMSFIVAWAIAILMAQDRGAATSWGGDLATTFILLPLIVLALARERDAIIGVWLLAAASAVSAVVLIADIVTGERLLSTAEAATTARTAEGFDRSSGASNSNPTTAATMLLTGTIIALVHAIETPRHRKVFVAVALIGTLAILLSFARSAMLVYGLVAVALWFQYRHHKSAGPIAVLAAIAMIAMIPFLPASFLDRITSIFGGGGDWTLNRRLTYNVIGLDLLLKYPLFGVGPGNFFELFTHQDYRYLPGRTLMGRQLHNMYLSVAVEYGLAGFACFAAIIIASMRGLVRTWKTTTSEPAAAAAKALFWGMVAYFVVSVFVPNEYIKYTWVLPALAAALTLSARKAQDGGPAV